MSEATTKQIPVTVEDLGHVTVTDRGDGTWTLRAGRAYGNDGRVSATVTLNKKQRDEVITALGGYTEQDIPRPVRDTGVIRFRGDRSRVDIFDDIPAYSSMVRILSTWVRHGAYGMHEDPELADVLFSEAWEAEGRGKD